MSSRCAGNEEPSIKATLFALDHQHGQRTVLDQLFALGEPIDGRTAVAWGLANRAVPGDQVQSTAKALADKLATRAPNSIRKTKALMRDAEVEPGRKDYQFARTIQFTP